MNGTLTDVVGLEVGHYTDLASATGCTVVMSRDGAVGGVDVRGAAPGTRETDLLRPENSVERVHGVLLGGGSAFGLAAADGVVRYLDEAGIGHRVGPVSVPIVPAAIIFDLGIGGAMSVPVRPRGTRRQRPRAPLRSSRGPSAAAPEQPSAKRLGASAR